MSSAASENQRYQGDVQEIAERIKAKQCILFIGSAIHAPALADSKYNYPPSKCPPIGNDLAKILLAQILVKDRPPYPFEDSENLQRVSRYYEFEFGFRSILVDAVRDAVHNGKEPSPVLRGLARLGFPIVITTNYDQLYERALTQVAREHACDHGKSEAEVVAVQAVFDKCIYSPKKTDVTADCANEPSSDCPYLLKIHGDVDKPNSIVITDEDYIQFIMRMGDEERFRPVGKNVLTYLISWPTLFIGYRLLDYNLRLLLRTLRWKLDDAEIPPNYSVDIQPDVLIRDVWEDRQRYIRFIPKDLWHFVPDLYRAVTDEEMPP